MLNPKEFSIIIWKLREFFFPLQPFSKNPFFDILVHFLNRRIIHFFDLNDGQTVTKPLCPAHSHAFFSAFHYFYFTFILSI